MAMMICYEIVIDLNKWIEEHYQYDKRVIKNDVCENLDNSTDMDNNETETENSNMRETETDYETDYETECETDEDQMQ